MTTKQASVLMAMSGGVDSSVAAKLLLDEGYDVTGITMKLFAKEDACMLDGEESTCCSLDDVEDAKSVCRRLGIEHYTLNLTREFKSHVMEKFCLEYLSGLTPNPCIDCNRFLKFDILHRRRVELGLDYLATGHYARRVFDSATDSFLLAKATDPKKDQSYVLYNITQDALAHTLFPLGDLTKADIRQIASQQDFVTAKKAESQDICFIPDGDVASFIHRFSKAQSCPGDIVDTKGNVLGKHLGLEHYTEGQRKGLGVSAGQRLYVIEKDVENNRLIVGFAEEISAHDFYASDLNWVNPAKVTGLNKPICLQAKIHYGQTPQSATATLLNNDLLKVSFDKPQQPSAPGQALVVYDGDIVVGGGTLIRRQEAL